MTTSNMTDFYDALCRAPTEQERLNTIERYGNINMQNEHGTTILMWAIYKENTEIAKLLINQGAKLDLQDATGNTALMIAVQKDNREIVNLIAQKFEKMFEKQQREIQKLQEKVKQTIKPSVNGGKVLKKIMAEKKKVISDWCDNWSNAWH